MATPRRSAQLWVALATVLSLAPSCSGEPPEPEASAAAASDSCVHARDGECDEPVNCPLGTDTTDCSAACAAGKTPFLLGAACAHLSPTAPPAVDDSVGSHGTSGLTGHLAGAIEVPSGASGEMVHRPYRLYVPATYDPSRPWPLVINMPGHRVDIDSQADAAELFRTADANRFIVVFAEQEWRADRRYAWWTDWSWTTRPNDNPDLRYLRELIARLESEYNIDRTRIFATGHSRGAAMSIIAALEMPDLIAGAVPQSGFTEFGYDARIRAYAGRKVPMVFVHGVSDTDVRIDCTKATCRIDASDSLVSILRGKGWSDDDLVYYRLDPLGHQWQPQLNQAWWDFLSARPLPKELLR